MRFRCTQCRTSMDQSLINDDEYRSFKRKVIGVESIRCPFCRKMALEVEA